MCNRVFRVCYLKTALQGNNGRAVMHYKNWLLNMLRKTVTCLLQKYIFTISRQMLMLDIIRSFYNSCYPHSTDIYCSHMLEDSGWTIRPTFDQSSVSWYNCVQSLITSRNRLNLTLLYVSQYPHIFLYFGQFPELSFNKLTDFSQILSLFTTTAIFTGSGCFW